jgi:hypothetical protein
MKVYGTILRSGTRSEHKGERLQGAFVGGQPLAEGFVF